MSDDSNDRRDRWSGLDSLFEVAGHVLEFLLELMTGIDF